MKPCDLEIIRQFDSLPDDMVVPSRITAILTDLSQRTVRYHPALPRRQLSDNRYGQRVGDIRALVRGNPITSVLTRQSAKPSAASATKQSANDKQEI